MAEKYQVQYSVDLVFCIDTTGSMDELLNTVKENALNLYQDFTQMMLKKRKVVSSVRVRVVAFRDYVADGDMAMRVTKFFHLPEEAESLRLAVSSLDADGGGDDPEDGLEALAYAMKSDWSRAEQKRRHVIVLWTDAPTHDLGFGKSAPNYPAGMPADFEELTRWWGCKGEPGVMDESAKRLLLFAPDAKSWSTIRDNWNNVIQFESKAGQGLREVDYSQILSAISNTI